MGQPNGQSDGYKAQKSLHNMKHLVQQRIPTTKCQISTEINLSMTILHFDKVSGPPSHITVARVSNGVSKPVMLVKLILYGGVTHKQMTIAGEKPGTKSSLLNL